MPQIPFPWSLSVTTIKATRKGFRFERKAETQGWHQPSAAGLLSNRNTGEDYKLGLTRALGQRKNQDSTRRDMQNRRAVLSFDLRCREACRCVDLNWGSNTNASVGPFEHAKHAAIPPSDGTQRKPCSQTGLGEVLQSPARKSTPNPFQGKHIEFDANLSFGRGGSESKRQAPSASARTDECNTRVPPLSLAVHRLALWISCWPLRFPPCRCPLLVLAPMTVRSSTW